MKPAVKVGSVVVQRTLHVPQRMKGKSLNRFVESAAFKNEVSKDRKLLAQNTEKAILLINQKESKLGSSPDTTTMASATKTQKQTSAKTTAKKGAAKKAAAAPAPAKKGARGAAKNADAVEEKGPGKIEQIIALHKQGKSNAEIVEAGFNKTTVSIQVSKYKKEKAAAKDAKKK